MSGSPPFWKHIPSLLPVYVLQRSTCSPSSNDLPGWSHFTMSHSGKGKEKKKKDTSSLAKRHGGLSLSLSGLTSWTLHTPMYKYLPLAKVQAAQCGCQTQQKTNIQGKVFTAVVAKGATASKRSHLIGWACVWCYHKAPGYWPLATGHWGVPTLSVMVGFFNAQPCHS